MACTGAETMVYAATMRRIPPHNGISDGSGQPKIACVLTSETSANNRSMNSEAWMMPKIGIVIPAHTCAAYPTGG